MTWISALLSIADSGWVRQFWTDCEMPRKSKFAEKGRVGGEMFRAMFREEE